MELAVVAIAEKTPAKLNVAITAIGGMKKQKPIVVFERRICEPVQSKKGNTMNKKSKRESNRVRRNMRAKAKRCYLNAFRLIQCVPEYAGAYYVEGMAVIGGILPIEHGWVEHQHEIVDPTLPNDDLEYVPGLRFKSSLELSKAFQMAKPDYCEDLPIFYRFGWGGIESLEFRAACAAAYRHAGNESLALQYESWSAKDVVVEHADCAVPLRQWDVEVHTHAEMAGNGGSQISA